MVDPSAHCKHVCFPKDNVGRTVCLLCSSKSLCIYIRLEFLPRVSSLWSHDATVHEGNRSPWHFADSLLDATIQTWLIFKDPLQFTAIALRQVFLADQFTKRVSRMLPQDVNLATRTLVEPTLAKNIPTYLSMHRWAGQRENVP